MPHNLQFATGGKIDIFPVESVQVTATSVSPSTWHVGTWVAFGVGRTLVGYDSGQTEFNSAGKTGGSKEMQQHNHTGTTSTDGNHAHSPIDGSTFIANGPSTANLAYPAGGKSLGGRGMANAGNHHHTFTTASAGTGNSGNLQPYITVFFWKRTA